MAIYHFSLKTIGRASGRSAVASAAYISGTKLRSQETGLSYNYRKKKEVVFRHVFLPADAPEEYQDREILWNAVQKIEKRSDARLARMIIVALPNEFSRDLQIQAINKYVKEQFVSKGMCADVAIHDKGDGNPHAHIMLTTRGFNQDGSWSKKERSTYKLDEDGNKIPLIDPETGLQKVRVRKGKGTEKLWERNSVPSNDWNKKENVEVWRKAWANLCNRYLKPDQQIDHRSFKRQGLDLEPTIHEGYAARQMEQKGLVSERVEYNRGVKERNQLRHVIRQKVEELYQGIMEKAREICGRIKRHLGIDEEGRSSVEPSRRRRQIDVRTAEGKRSLEETESFLEARIREGQETDQGIGRTSRSIDQSERKLCETERDLTRTESEIDSIKQRLDRQREENERRFRKIMDRHQRLMGGEACATRNGEDTTIIRHGRELSETDRRKEWNHSKSEKKDPRSGNVIKISRDRDGKSGVNVKTSGNIHQNHGIFVQRQGEHVQHTNDASGGEEPKDPRTGAAIGESVKVKQPVKARKKAKQKEIGFPRL